MTADTSTTRDRFLETAADLFLRQGYEKTPVAQILERTGVGAGSFYYHFKSKEDLLMAVLERYGQLMPEVFEKPVYQTIEDPVERVFGILDAYRRFLLDTDFKLGCPVGNIALEMGPLVARVRRKTADLFENWRLMVRRCLDDASERLPADLDRAELAVLVLTVMEGGVMQARAAGSISPFDASVRQLRRYFDLLLSKAKAD